MINCECLSLNEIAYFLEERGFLIEGQFKPINQTRQTFSELIHHLNHDIIKQESLITPSFRIKITENSTYFLFKDIDSSWIEKLDDNGDVFIIFPTPNGIEAFLLPQLADVFSQLTSKLLN